MKRSPREIAFRLRQEAVNIWLLYSPAPAYPEPSLLPLPHPNEIKPLLGPSFAEDVIRTAEAVLSRKFPLLGDTIQTAREIRWRRDYRKGLETGLDYFRLIPYLDAERAGDHKLIWELNRHQHLVLLSQAHLLTRRPDFLEDLWYQLETWLEQNAFCRGMNWTSALEVAFRALSWVWIEHLAGKEMPARLRKRWLAALYQHGLYLANNLSFYFSPNTHLQGEALALHALGLLFARKNWREEGSRILREIVHTHVRKDGSHFEQSSYYHVYALDMFLFHAILSDNTEPGPEDYTAQLRRMADYLWALSSPGEFPLLGDDDGGRLFYPYGNQRAFGRATLATCAAWLGGTPWHGNPEDVNEQAIWYLGSRAKLPPEPASPPFTGLFPDAGVAILGRKDLHLVADTRGFGFRGAGHSHAHALHFTLRRNGVEVLLDPGTFTYVADPARRDSFRGTAFHNTVVIDHSNQADPAGPFRWNNVPVPGKTDLSLNPWHLRAACSYRGLRHARQWVCTAEALFILDSFTGPGSHQLEQMWHTAGPIGKVTPFQFELPAGVRLVLPEKVAVILEEGWYSPAPNACIPVPVIRVATTAVFPYHLAAAFLFSASRACREPLQVKISSAKVLLSIDGLTAEFS